MEKILNAIRWIFGAVFCLASLTAISRGEIVPAIILIFLGLLLIPPAFRLLFKRKTGGVVSAAIGMKDFFNGNSKIIKLIDFSGQSDIISSIESAIRNQIKPLTDNARHDLGKSVYPKLLEKSIEDSEITQIEKDQLIKVAQHFNLSDQETGKLKSIVKEAAAKKLIEKQYGDNIFTDIEKEELFAFATYLGFDERGLEKIRKNIASSLFKAALNASLKDKVLTPNEETELNQALKNLKIDEETKRALVPNSTLQELAFAKLLWQLENGVFTKIESPQLTLKKNEECYLAVNGQLLDTKTVNKGYSHASSGFSFRVMKGVSYRVGSGRSVPIKEQVTVKHSGVLYLTSGRIVFSSVGKNSFQIGFNKLLTFEVYSDGLGFVIEGWTYLLEIQRREKELFATALSSAIRNYLDESNDTRTKAQEEIDKNEIFIDVKHQSGQ